MIMNQMAHTHIIEKASDSCPYCGHEITHDELVAIEQRIEKEQQEKFAAREKQLNAKHMETMSELHKQISSKDDAAQAQLKAEKDKYELALAAKDKVVESQVKVARKSEREKILKENNEEKLKLKREQEAIEVERVQIRTDKDAMEKTHKANIDQQRVVLEADTQKKLLAQKSESDRDTYRLKQIVEGLNRKLEKKSNEELGDGAEVDLYNELKSAFPDDVITRVKKGVAGADIKHDVHIDGRLCGKIVYDSKNRNDWKSAYAEQLRKDQLAEKADHAILATRKFPKDKRELAERDGMFLVNPSRAVVLAKVFREALVQLSTVKISEQGKQDKQKKLYEFIISSRCNNLFTRFEDEITHLRALDVTEKKQQGKMRNDRAKHVGEIEKTVVGDLLHEIHEIIGY